jgi:hypothetical protein
MTSKDRLDEWNENLEDWVEFLGGSRRRKKKSSHEENQVSKLFSVFSSLLSSLWKRIRNSQKTRVSHSPIDRLEKRLS